MTTSTHSYHGYQLVLHHESDDRYRVTIFDPRGNRVLKASQFVLGLLVAIIDSERYIICIPLRLGQNTRGQTEVL